MADTRATQSALLLPAGGPEAIRATQTAALVLADIPAVAIRATQGMLLALSGVMGDGMRATQSLLLVLAHHVPCLARWAQCWRIERSDGEVFRFTSHDEALTFRGESYLPCRSLAASASELGAVLGAPGDVELAGIIADETISERDLYAGAFDRARVEVWMVPWADAGGIVPFQLTAGVVAEIGHGIEGFSMRVETDGARLQQQPLLPVYTPSCRWELGDARCGVDLEALAVDGSVTQAAAVRAYDAASRRAFWDSSRAEADGYFDQGLLEWTSGPNAGLQAQVKSYAGGLFVLWEPMISAVAVGDGYRVRPGCDKAAETCKAKFSNYPNFGGFPDVPGRDGIMQTPDSKG